MKISAITEVIVIPKTTKMLLGFGLTHDEFKCTCNHQGCHYTLINKTLLSNYVSLRRLVDTPLEINSGYRCMHWNTQVKGTVQSSHVLGLAIDISLTELTESQREAVYDYAKVVFDFVQLHDTFIHCQVNV